MSSWWGALCRSSPWRTATRSTTTDTPEPSPIAPAANVSVSGVRHPAVSARPCRSRMPGARRQRGRGPAPRVPRPAARGRPRLRSAATASSARVRIRRDGQRVGTRPGTAHRRCPCHILGQLPRRPGQVGLVRADQTADARSGRHQSRERGDSVGGVGPTRARRREARGARYRVPSVATPKCQHRRTQPQARSRTFQDSAAGAPPSRRPRSLQRSTIQIHPRIACPADRQRTIGQPAAAGVGPRRA